MIRASATTVILLLVVGASVASQTPSPDSNASMPTYRFIDQTRTFKTISNTERLLTEAGRQGFGIVAVARYPRSLAMILKRDGAGPRTYQLINTKKRDTLIKEVNDAGARGFRLISAKPLQDWTAVMVQNSAGGRFSYKVIDGEDTGAHALGEGSRQGVTLTAVLGGDNRSPELILEAPMDGVVGDRDTPEREYRILATRQVNTLEKEIKQAAAEGFRAIDAGVLTVIMAREPKSTSPLLDYRVVAVGRVSTGQRELQDAGAQGFRLAVALSSSGEGIFVLHRTIGAAERFEYQIGGLTEENGSDILSAAERNGYRVAALLSDIVVLERSLDAK